MIVFLLLIPLLVIITSVGIYQLNGKKEILKLDLVQFFYAFVVAPLLFIWTKSVLFLILNTEVTVLLSAREIFLFDTIYSTFFLYVFAFIVMHTLTKSINLKVGRDPFHDIFKHSEYFHLWISHLVMFLGGALLFTILGLANSIIPMSFILDQYFLYIFIFSGCLAGLMIFIGIWLSDPKQERASFMRIIKLFYGILLTVHILFYFIFNPSFRIQYSLYWASTTLFATYVVCSFFAYKSGKAKTIFEKISDQLKHSLWDTRVQLFSEAAKKRTQRK